MSGATRSRGPSFKHDILLDPPPSPTPSSSTQQRSKKNGDPAGHRTKCKDGRSKSNRGKTYKTPAARMQIIRDDPTGSLIPGRMDVVHCDVCGEDKELENDRLLLTGWYCHSGTAKHQRNAQRHLSVDEYSRWLEWLAENNVKLKEGLGIRSPSISAYSNDSTPAPYTPPRCITPSRFTPPFPEPQYASLSTGQDEASYDADSSAITAPSLAHSFRLRPALWSGPPTSAMCLRL
ncbi:hypothetical protein NMY22_g4387 [Coprinellus aureogranulatus]|nr:hypothetical protein NMY22_g16742 [Coprinellus aureogranulatus]KAJ3540214.1 hypothetical protein NMY22_g4387 [Coprinellus aureogranulatus]